MCRTCGIPNIGLHGNGCNVVLGLEGGGEVGRLLLGAGGCIVEHQGSTFGGEVLGDGGANA